MQTKGFGDLGEDAGGHAHQVESQNNSRVVLIKKTKKREKCKSQFAFMSKLAKVKEEIIKVNKVKTRKRRNEDEPSNTSLDKLNEEDYATLLTNHGKPVLLSDIKKMKILEKSYLSFFDWLPIFSIEEIRQLWLQQKHHGYLSLTSIDPTESKTWPSKPFKQLMAVGTVNWMFDWIQWDNTFSFW